jgi:hypothetical protein
MLASWCIRSTELLSPMSPLSLRGETGEGDEVLFPRQAELPEAPMLPNFARITVCKSAIAYTEPSGDYCVDSLPSVFLRITSSGAITVPRSSRFTRRAIPSSCVHLTLQK